MACQHPQVPAKTYGEHDISVLSGSYSRYFVVDSTGCPDVSGVILIHRQQQRGSFLVGSDLWHLKFKLIFFLTPVDPPAPSCQEGVYLPRFVQPTPENEARIQAEVNKEVEIRVKAQATHST